MDSRKKDILLVAGIVCLPFFIFSWMLPFVSGLTLGNDYQNFPIHEQLELQFSLKTGSFPLFIPGYACGQSASALTLGQLFHPISHIAAHMPGYWNGKALEWNTLLRLLSLGLAHLALFGLLRQMKLGIWPAFIFSFITVYNLRMLDLFRYGASLESWTGFLFLCAAVGRHWFQPDGWRGPLYVIGATYLLVCSGHPQMMYYGLIGAGLFTLVIPYFLELRPDGRPVPFLQALRFWMRIGLFVFTGVVLSSAYLLPFYFDFLAHNSSRVGQAYAWADIYRDTFMGTLNNFFQPLRSDVSGVFGGSSLLLAAALMPLLAFVRLKIPRVIWVIWGVLLLAFLHMQGARTPVHYLAWKYLPLASSIRIAGRISMIMPVFFMLMLVWISQCGACCLRGFSRELRITPATMLATAALFLFILYALVPNSIVADTSSYAATNIHRVPRLVLSSSFGAGAAALSVFALLPIARRAEDRLYAVWALLVCLQAVTVFPYGTWVVKKNHTPTFSRMLSDHKQSLNYKMATGAWMATDAIIRQVKHTFLESYPGRIYRTCRPAENNDAAYRLMQQSRRPDEVTIERYPDADCSGSRVSYDPKKPDRVRLIYSSFNRLVFQLQADGGGFFQLAYPFTGNWKGWVNHRETRVYRANGAYHAVRIPAGTSEVEFRYWSPAVFWGMIISCSLFIGLGVVFGLGALGRRSGMVVSAAVLVIGVGVFFLWYQSLYSGNNLGTDYFWQEAPPERVVNIAYGKRTNMTTLSFPNYLYYRSSGFAVDGVKTPGSGFISGVEFEPWWMVDLYQSHLLGSIVIYEDECSPNDNRRPLSVLFSADGKQWRLGAKIYARCSKQPLVLNFPDLQQTRYVLIKASGTCRLAFDEVEIFTSPRPDLKNPGSDAPMRY